MEKEERLMIYYTSHNSVRTGYSDKKIEDIQNHTLIEVEVDEDNNGEPEIIWLPIFRIQKIVKIKKL